ncbi:MAG: hypothetical protein Q3962_08030 [Corynebacterium sp.]|nr:hypothetical protein [Corynebacterium sp.]
MTYALYIRADASNNPVAVSINGTWYYISRAGQADCSSGTCKVSIFLSELEDLVVDKVTYADGHSENPNITLVVEPFTVKPEQSTTEETPAETPAKTPDKTSDPDNPQNPDNPGQGEEPSSTPEKPDNPETPVNPSQPTDDSKQPSTTGIAPTDGFGVDVSAAESAIFYNGFGMVVGATSAARYANVHMNSGAERIFKVTKVETGQNASTVTLSMGDSTTTMQVDARGKVVNATKFSDYKGYIPALDRLYNNERMVAPYLNASRLLETGAGADPTSPFNQFTVVEVLPLDDSGTYLPALYQDEDWLQNNLARVAVILQNSNGSILRAIYKAQFIEMSDNVPLFRLTPDTSAIRSPELYYQPAKGTLDRNNSLFQQYYEALKNLKASDVLIPGDATPGFTEGAYNNQVLRQNWEDFRDNRLETTLASIFNSRPETAIGKAPIGDSSNIARNALALATFPKSNNSSATTDSVDPDVARRLALVLNWTDAQANFRIGSRGALLINARDFLLSYRGGKMGPEYTLGTLNDRVKRILDSNWRYGTGHAGDWFGDLFGGSASANLNLTFANPQDFLEYMISRYSDKGTDFNAWLGLNFVGQLENDGNAWDAIMNIGYAGRTATHGQHVFQVLRTAFTDPNFYMVSRGNVLVMGDKSRYGSDAATKVSMLSRMLANMSTALTKLNGSDALTGHSLTIFDNYNPDDTSPYDYALIRLTHEGSSAAANQGNYSLGRAESDGNNYAWYVPQGTNILDNTSDLSTAILDSYHNVFIGKTLPANAIGLVLRQQFDGSVGAPVNLTLNDLVGSMSNGDLADISDKSLQASYAKTDAVLAQLDVLTAAYARKNYDKKFVGTDNTDNTPALSYMLNTVDATGTGVTQVTNSNTRYFNMLNRTDDSNHVDVLRNMYLAVPGKASLTGSYYATGAYYALVANGWTGLKKYSQASTIDEGMRAATGMTFADFQAQRLEKARAALKARGIDPDNPSEPTFDKVFAGDYIDSTALGQALGDIRNYLWAQWSQS